jgi:rhodanese-related sulfurtransferase
MSTESRFLKLAADAKSRISEISPTEADALAQKGALLIDVRELHEFAAGHAAGAIHLSRGLLELEIEEKAPDVATPVLCICGGGSRSALAADNLQKMGYTNVKSVSGGLRAWKEAGLPLASGR